MAIHNIEIISSRDKLENEVYFEEQSTNTKSDIIDRCYSINQETYGSLQAIIENNFDFIGKLGKNTTIGKHLSLIGDEFKKYCLISCLYTTKMLLMENELVEIAKLENELKYFGNDYMKGIVYNELHRNKTRTYKFNKILKQYKASETEYRKNLKFNSSHRFGGYDYLYPFFNFYISNEEETNEKNKHTKYYTDLFLSNFTYRYLSATNNNRKMWGYLKEYVEVINGDNATDKKNLKRGRTNLQYWINDMLRDLRPYSYNYMKTTDILFYHYKYESILHLNYLKRYGNKQKNKGYKSLSDKELHAFIDYHSKIMNLQNSILNTHLLEVLDYVYDDYIDCLYKNRQCVYLPWFIDNLIEYIEQFTKSFFFMLYEMCFSKANDQTIALKVMYDKVLKKLKLEFDSDLEEICKLEYLNFQYNSINDNDIIYFRTLLSSFKVDMFV